MKKYKLTTQNLTTYKNFKWVIGEEVVTSGKGVLCSRGWLHYYHSPLLAVILNPIHANIKNPKLFEIKASGKHLDDNRLKGGCTKMTLIKEIPLPIITLNQKIAFTILCSLEIYKDIEYKSWAINWLQNINRTHTAAANAAANVATADAAGNAAYSAANIVVNVANIVANAAANVVANIVANIAAANVVANIAANVAYSAATHADDDNKLNLILIAKKALKYK